MVYNIISYGATQIVSNDCTSLDTFPNFYHGFRTQDSGFRNRAVKHSLMTRRLIPGYRGANPFNNSIGTPSGSFKQPGVSVLCWSPYVNNNILL